jgi:hypothetical protein
MIAGPGMKTHSKGPLWSLDNQEFVVFGLVG